LLDSAALGAALALQGYPDVCGQHRLRYKVNAAASIFLCVSALALLLLPGRWAALPLLVGACYMTLAQELAFGPFNFPVLRLLIAVGILRALLRGERVPGPFNSLDALLLCWAVWALFSSLFHEDPTAALVNRMGIVYYACGLYFLLRVFCSEPQDAVRLATFTAVLLMPLALVMLSEQATGRNFFAFLGGVAEMSEIRGGEIRAQGPFAHPILAGSVGATSLPLMAMIWHRHRWLALAGATACLTIVMTSASSGPLLSVALAVGALALWPWRQRMRQLRWIAVGVYLMLEVVMKAPAYFLLARVDLTGSSTSWHRAELIDSAIRHLSEWWLFGTDYTRHWISYGVGWSEKHTDITNYYINMGVWGGLPLMLLFIGVIAIGFARVGRQLGCPQADNGIPPFAIWALGCTLFAHAGTFISIAYFDQSVMFLYLTLAAIVAASRGAVPAREPVLSGLQATG
jgi:uncharacterized integral membrane protein